MVQKGECRTTWIDTIELADQGRADCRKGWYRVKYRQQCPEHALDQGTSTVSRATGSVSG